MKQFTKYAIICFCIYFVFTIIAIFSSKVHFGVSGYIVFLISGSIFTTIGVFLGDVFRRFVMPDIYFTTGAFDTFQKKIFWMIGPQCIGWLMGFMATENLMKHVTDQPTPIEIAQEAPTEFISTPTSDTLVNSVQTPTDESASTPLSDSLAAPIAETASISPSDSPVALVQTPAVDTVSTTPPSDSFVESEQTPPAETVSKPTLDMQIIEAAERTNQTIHDSVLPIETPPPPVNIEQTVENQQTSDNNQIQKEREELARYKAKDAIDEANKQINIDWNATTKNVRTAILPEQREWLMRRESDCGLKASSEEPNNSVVQETIKLHCMTSMTNERTEALKLKIASLQSTSNQ